MSATLPETALAPAATAAAGSPHTTRQYVSFAIGNEMFAVPMEPVQEIIRVPEVARLPLAPPALDGLANLRGRVLPIVNLRRLFGIDERRNDDASRALVINLGSPLGFVVDRVASVVSVEPGQMEAADGIRSLVSADYLTGVVKRTQADGSSELLLALDFGQLVQAQFARLKRDVANTAGEQAAAAAVADAGSEAGAVAASDELRLVSFTVASQEYAIDIADVQEIVQVPARITALPNTPAHVLGVISLRQRLLPLVSLRSLFGLPTQALTEQHRIVVITLPGGHQVGLVTDAVKEVLSVPRNQTEPMPGVLARDGQLQEFASMCRLDGGKRLVSVIATERLLGLQAVRDAVWAASQADTEQASSEQENRVNTTASTEEDTQVVIFRLGSEEFGVPIMSVQEIVRVPDSLTRVPKTPAFVEGVINLRGTVLPVIDQRARLGLAHIERNDRQRIMVYTLGSGLRTGFIVDAVAEVLRIPRQQVEAAPALSDEQALLINRVAKLDGGKRLVLLIDPDQLLGAGEARLVGKLAGGGSGEAVAAGPEWRRAA
jgi:purine-binding chemotaxis protein CheW